MRKFMINVNGSRYEVEVEEVAAGQSAAAPAMSAAPAPAAAPAAPAAPAASAAPAPAPAPKAAKPAGGSGRMGSEAIKAPMPGTILSVSVSVGQPVEKNQVVCVLEAMKMENEIVASRAGVVAGVHTSKGSSVSAGEVLVSLD